MILVTGASGMFGGRIVAELARRGAPVRGLVRRDDAAQQLREVGVEPAIADLDDRSSLDPAMRGVEAVLLISPMDDRIAAREANVLDAALSAGVGRIVKLYGAVKHRGDPLDQLHTASIEAIRGSGTAWALVSPNSVMETSLLNEATWISGAGAINAPAGDARIGMVAADDVARAAAVVLTEPGDSGANYELTGPESLSLADIAAVLTRIVGREIAYNDVPEDDFRRMLVDEAGMTAEQAELGVLVHYRAWKRGDADLVTDTYRELTGNEPTSLEAWATEHRDAFASAG